MALYNFIRSCINSHTINAVKKATTKMGKSSDNTVSKMTISNLERIKLEEERKLKEEMILRERELEEERLKKERVLREKWIEKQNKLKKRREVSKDVKGKKISKKRKREKILEERAIAKEFKKYLAEKEVQRRK